VTRIVLHLDDPGIERRVRDALGEDRYRGFVSVSRPVPEADPDGVAKVLSASLPDLIVLGPPAALRDALRIATVIDDAHPEITVVLVAEPTTNLYEQALRAGIRDVVPREARAAAYRSVIDHALHVADVRRSNIIDLTDSAMSPAGRIITVVSPKGGAGKTTVATNLAMGLAQRAHEQVAIVDLDLQFGDVASALQLSSELSLADLLPGEAETDPAKIKLLLAHHPEGLFALCSPDDPAAADDVRSEDVAPTLRALAADLRYVVVDTCAGIDQHTLAAIEVSTDVVLVGAMDVPSVRSLRKLVDTLDRLGMTDARRLVVLNRSDSRVDLKPGDIAAAIGLPIAISIPSSRSVPLSINHGCPVLLFDPRSPVVRPLQELVGLVCDEPVLTLAGGGSHSFFGRTLR
jgi:pilus assembly protein CpaE